jgi:HTH-type transcriptional regulator/antitoxin HigA
MREEISMNNAEPLRTANDYERALKEIEMYFENQPTPGTEASSRFELLATLISEYEAVHFPMPG